jgi:3,4-dihydroxy 2-butanone 4-phosphate synthase/GTP cyclohydrolase II
MDRGAAAERIDRRRTVPGDDGRLTPRSCAHPTRGGRVSAMAPVELAVRAIARGDMVIVVNREAAGDFVVAAERASAEAINFMTTFGRGLVRVPMTPSRLAELEIHPMTRRNHDSQRRAFHVGVDARRRTSSGISAADRALTARALADPGARPADFTIPGHLFPLAAQSDGLGSRPGHTEAAVELARLAGLQPAAVICEIFDDDGRMATLPTLMELAAEHRMPIASVADIAEYARRNPAVERVTSAALPLAGATFTAVGYLERAAEREHIALVLGDVASGRPLVHVHSHCVMGDVFHSLRCDCGSQLRLAIDRIAREGRGAVIYLGDDEARGIGLPERPPADAPEDTAAAGQLPGHQDDGRGYGVAAAILRDLGAQVVRLMTNDPESREALTARGIDVGGCAPAPTSPTSEHGRGAETKVGRTGHRRDMIDGPATAAG